MIRGQAKFDGITMGEFSANFLSPTVELKCKAAFINQGTGATHGWTNGASWSPETIQKLNELKESMEKDLGKVHFVGGGESFFSGNSTSSGGTMGPSGLGEHIDDAPQV